MIYKKDTPFDHIIEMMRRTNRKAIRSPEVVGEDKNGKVFKVFLQDATLTIKRYADNKGISMLRVSEIGAPEKPASEMIKEMRATLKTKLNEVTGIEWSVASKVNVPQYQFLFLAGKFKVLSPEYDLAKLFREPPDLEQLAGMIGALYKEKSNNGNKEESKTNG